MDNNKQQDYNCYICYGMTEDYMVCDNCEEHYCEDCSYHYTLHYQYQGSQCYQCSDQTRRIPLTTAEIRDNAINMILNE